MWGVWVQPRDVASTPPPAPQRERASGHESADPTAGCPHRERVQARDESSGEPVGHMRCLACGAHVAPKVAGAGRCSVCGATEGVRTVEIAMPGGGALAVSRCPRCAPPPAGHPGVPGARNVGGGPGSAPR